MKSKFFAIFSIIFLLSLATAAAGTMELNSNEGKIILKVVSNDIPIAAGRIFMKTTEAITLYKPFGTGFLGNIYAIKGTNSNMEMQFFDPIANKQLGQLEIPFTGPAGTYTFQITKIELYNKSDYLIPFNQPLQTIFTISAQDSQPEQQQGSSGSSSNSGTIGSKAGEETIFEPEVTQVKKGSGTEGTKTTQEQTNNEANQTQSEEKVNTLPPILPIAGFSIAIAVIIVIIFYEFLHHKKAITIPLSFQ